MTHGTLVAIFAVLMLPGVLGTLLPVLPGIPLMFLVAVVFGFVDRWQHLLPWELAVLFGVVLLSLLSDFFSGLIGARYGGASRRSALWGMAGMVIGLLVFPPFGGLIGLSIGVLVAELLGHKDRVRAFRAAVGSLMGTIVGIIAGFSLAVMFLLLFVLFALR